MPVGHCFPEVGLHGTPYDLNRLRMLLRTLDSSSVSAIIEEDWFEVGTGARAIFPVHQSMRSE